MRVLGSARGLGWCQPFMTIQIPDLPPHQGFSVVEGEDDDILLEDEGQGVGLLLQGEPGLPAQVLLKGQAAFAGRVPLAVLPVFP